MIEVVCPCCGSNESTEYARGYDYEYNTSQDCFSFVKCKNCLVLYLNPRPALNELQRIYPPEYEPYHFNEKSISLHIRNIIESRKAFLLTHNLNQGARILDAGCGGVAFLNAIDRINKKKWELWGNDIDDETCKRISAAGYQSIVGRLEELSLPDKFFDMIVLKQVIEHLDNPSTVITNAFRLLKCDGELVIETPNSESIDCHLFGHGVWGGYHFPRHWTIFNTSSLVPLGKKAGFEVKSINFMFSPVFWVQSVHHMLLKFEYPKWIVNMFTIRNPFFLSFACACDLIEKIFTGKTSNMRIIFKVPKS